MHSRDPEWSSRVRPLIRTQLKNGLLRLGPVAQTWIGPGIGQSCDACISLIESADTEFEIIFIDGRTLRLHVGCHVVWKEERQREPRPDLDPPPAEIVRRLLSDSANDALCDSCLAIACRTSLDEMRDTTRALAVEDSNIQHGVTCASCRRTVACILFQTPIAKCVHCSKPLSDSDAGVLLGGDRFHDVCLRRLISDETVRVSRFLSRRSRELIEQSRRRIREGHV